MQVDQRARQQRVPASATRRAFVAGAGALGLRLMTGAGPAQAETRPAAMPQPTTPADEDWQAFRRRFISHDGRVVDTGQGGCSHSEGQGWGLMFAVAADDQETFDLVLEWTATHLRRPGDALHAWRYVPGAARPVADWNNATDGDIYIASGLLRAAERWHRPDLALAGACIAHDVLRLLVRDVGGRTLLLPGAQGFEPEDGVTINPSYYAFPLLAELAAAAPSPRWAALSRDGLDLIEQGRFGPWRLPPDWLHVARDSGALTPHPAWPPRFSYDAIRVPLFLSWAQGRAVDPLATSLFAPAPADDGVAAAFNAYWHAARIGEAAQAEPPAWVDLTTNRCADYPAPLGMVAVARLVQVQSAAFAPRPEVKPGHPVRFPRVASAPDYYSAALILLSKMAWQESRIG